jgi:hypothetical protein
VLVGSIGRPKPRSPAGHRAEVSEHPGVSETREVGDDRRGRPVSERERESKRARAGSRCWALGLGLDPLGKFVNGDEQVGEATSCPFQRSDQVESPNSEQPCDGNSLQGMSREVGLSCIVLTSFAGAY